MLTFLSNIAKNLWALKNLFKNQPVSYLRSVILKCNSAHEIWTSQKYCVMTFLLKTQFFRLWVEQSESFWSEARKLSWIIQIFVNSVVDQKLREESDVNKTLVHTWFFCQTYFYYTLWSLGQIYGNFWSPSTLPRHLVYTFAKPLPLKYPRGLCITP